MSLSCETDADQLRTAFGHFPTGVTVITTVGLDGEPAGTTATAVSSLSLEPALLLACLGSQSATLRAVLAHGSFAVNVLAHDQEAISRHFARSGPASSFADVAHDRWPSGTPRLDGTIAVIDCALHDVLTGGDHEIVIGRVRDLAIDRRGRPPLVHWRGGYARLGEPA